MKIIKNEKLIKRNGRIGNWTTIIALAVLSGGMFLSISNPTDSNRVIYSAVALVVGFALTQIGLYMGNRWGRSPRPDEILDASLKGLTGEFTAYHYSTPVPHLLAGPSGIWALIPYRQRGVITYHKNRWRVGQGGFMQAYMSIFGQEGIGNPDLEAENQIGRVKKLLAKYFEENEIPAVHAALIFVNEQVEIQAEDTTFPALKAEQLKGFMRQKAKEKPISQTQLTTAKAALSE